MKVIDLCGNVWRGCQTLDFAVSVSSRTGEVLTNKPQLADHKGLTFKIVPPIDPQGKESCYVLGSLHKFKNQGLHNANGFTMSDIKNVVSELEELHIDPLSTVLENIEFGVNIELPYPCQMVLDSMISMSNRQFVELKFSGVPNGKRLCRDQYELKIYDKGKAETGKESHLLRVELRVKKMQFLSKAVVTLGDLTDVNKLLSLGQILEKHLKAVVMYGGDFAKIDTYSPRISAKLWQWTNPNYWSRLEKKERFKEQKDFEAFNQSTGTGTMKAVLINAVCDKWYELLGVAPSVSGSNETVLGTIAPTFETVLDEIISSNETVSRTFLPTFETVLQASETVSNETVSPKRNGLENLFTIKIKGKKVLEQQTTKQGGGLERGARGENQNFTISRTCECCGVDISTKRPQSVFCSVACKNRFNNSRRSKVAPSVSGAVEPSPMVVPAKVERSKVAPSVSAVEPSPMVVPAKVERSKVAPSVSAVKPSPMVVPAKVERSKVAPSVSAVKPSPMVVPAKVERSKVAPSVSATVGPSPKIEPSFNFMEMWGELNDADFDKWYNKKR